MLPVQFEIDRTQNLRVLCIGAHSDDIEIGCGGTLLHLCSSYSVNLTWAVLGAPGDRRGEAERSAEAFAGSANSMDLHIENFRNSHFPWQGSKIKDYIDALNVGDPPDVIFTHYREDLHQDHRLISDLTWNTFRNHNIFEYEIPKFDGDFGSPNFFVPLEKNISQQKVSLILEHFRSQKHRSWFNEETFWAVMRLRGVECNSHSGYAEAFYSRKMILGRIPGR